MIDLLAIVAIVFAICILRAMLRDEVYRLHTHAGDPPPPITRPTSHKKGKT